jgi:hypothetical protein
VSESYAVRECIVEDIIQRLGCGQPVLDAFASSQNHRFPRWWGEGGEKPDALAESWSDVGLLWCNPPFSQFQAVLRKVAEDQAQCVLIIPDWQTKQYWKDA